VSHAPVHSVRQIGLAVAATVTRHENCSNAHVVDGRGRLCPLKIDRKSLQRGQVDPKFQVEGVAPHQSIARIVEPMNALQLCRWQFSHKETLKQTFFKRSAILHRKRPFCIFELRKLVVDFLLVLIDFFSLGVTAEAVRANIGSKSAISLQRGPVDPKFQVERVPHQPFFFLEN